MSDLKYPRGETVWVRHYDDKENLLFIITSKPTRDFYILYEVKNNTFVKFGKSKNPGELASKFLGSKERKE